MSTLNLSELATKWCSRLIALCQDEPTKTSLQNLKKYFEGVVEVPNLTTDKESFLANVYEKLLAIDQSPYLTNEILADTLQFASARIQTTADILSKPDEQLFLTVLSNFYLCFGSLYLTISCTTTDTENKKITKKELLTELLTEAYDAIIMEFIKENMSNDEYFNEEILAYVQMGNYDENDQVRKTSMVIKEITKKFRLPENLLINFVIDYNNAIVRRNLKLAELIRKYVFLCEEEQKEASIENFIKDTKLDCPIDEEYFSILFKSYIEKYVIEENEESEPPTPTPNFPNVTNLKSMNTSIQAFIDYLLDVETTSDIIFNEEIIKNQELYNKRYLTHFEQIINNQLKRWMDVDQIQQSATVHGSKKKPPAENDNSDDEWEEDNLTHKQEKEAIESFEKIQTTEKVDQYIDVAGQCQRLLQLLYYSQQHYAYFSDIYLSTIECCIKSDNEKLITLALQQIVLHLSENIKQDDQKQQKRLLKCLPTDILSSTLIPIQQEILKNIQKLVSINEIIFSSDNIADLYPYKSRFIDVRQEFRDSTHYFIDGDSLLLSIAHYTNVNLKSYYGNTIHVIYIIERILLTLSNQSNQCNYTLLFFDCHYQLYKTEKSILNLLRACLISHFSKNTTKCRIAQFSSWLDDEYFQFAREEKPMFLFYHDMSNFHQDNDLLLSNESIEKILITYRLYGNYHQYYIQTHLYLMNKFTLTNTSVECFQIRFTQKCSMEVLSRCFKFLSAQPSSVRKQQNETNKELEDLVSKIPDIDVRLYLYLKTLIQNQPEMQNRVKHFSSLLILHVALLTRLSLIDRHLPLDFPSVEFSSLFSEFIIEFQRKLAWNLSSSCSMLLWEKVVDIFDGRLFAFTLNQIYQPSFSSNIRFDSMTLNIIKESLNILNIPFEENLYDNVVKQLIASEDITFSSCPMQQPPTLLRQKQNITKISNTFIDTYLQPILSSNDVQSRIQWISPDESHGIQYEGKHHWHRYMEVGHEIDRIRNNDAEYKKFDNTRYKGRMQQKLYNYFQAYGESLTNSDVKDTKLEIILPSIQSEEKQQIEKKKHIPKINKLKGQNEAAMKQRKIADENERLKNMESEIKDKLSESFLAAIDYIDKSLLILKEDEVRIQLLQRKFDLQRSYLQSLRKKTILTGEEQSKLELLQVAYFSTLSIIVKLEGIQRERDIYNKKRIFMEELIDQSPIDFENWYRFQIEKVNSRLPRREQNQPDSRVSLFSDGKWNPDPWQVDFLNAIDQQQSVIIVAPTASGKTYACYYAMYQVINDKFGRNGVCIYVAPTKALVNQVAATIYSKFDPVFGVFTRDFRERVETCKILVTVPQCLEIILMSAKHQQWCQRIKYCIFDEVHCMSSILGSEVWERTMLLINCPMIGLSATVNNGQDLCRWIEHVEQQRSILFKISQPRQVRFIPYDERLADLNKYLYSNRQLYHIHPVGLMTAKQLNERGLPKDFSLSPCETLQLNDAMKDKQIPTLTEYFAPSWICERTKCNQYSTLVRERFESLITHRQDSRIDAIAKSLQPVTTENNSYPESKSLSSLIVEFVLTLKEKDLLPCIVFTDNRRLCEQMAQAVTDYFVAEERKLRETKYKAAYNAAKRKEEELKRTKKSRESSAKRDQRSRSRTPSEDNEKEDETRFHLTGYERKILYGVLDECTLVNRHGYDRKLVAKLSKRAAQHHQRLASYMKRGIAYHHAELFNKGRVAVEALFRNRYIQIVFSTATLAMGIHMPTKTVAFINDSIFLDALSYRQSSGRAGRRGFDIQGNIVFIDIPLSKIRHLITSSIPDIRAHSLTSVTFLMRLLQLYSNGKDKNDAMNRSLIALQYPFMSQFPMKHRLVDLQTRFHCLHTLDFLHRIGLVNGKGDLIGLAGLSTHLNYNEPANILLVYLINTEFFHKLTDQKDIITTLARIFTNMPWLITRKQFELLDMTRRQRKLNAKLFLPAMSDEFIATIQTYNSIVKDVYGAYIENVTREMRHCNEHRNQEQILPFSEISFVQSPEYDNGTFEYQLCHHHSQQSANPSISPFASVSGLTHQQYMSNYNLSASSWDLAYDLDLSTHVVPFVDLNVCDHNNSTYQLNSYAADFFKHGSEKLLISENQLSPNDTNKLLTDFHLTLSSIKTSLEIIVDHEKKIEKNDLAFFEPLYKSFRAIQEAFATKYYEEYPRAHKL